MRVWFAIRYTISPGMLLGSFPAVYPSAAGREDDIREWAQKVFNTWCATHNYNKEYLDWSLYCHVIDGYDSHESR